MYDNLVWQLYTEGWSLEAIMHTTGYTIQLVLLVIKRRSKQ